MKKYYLSDSGQMLVLALLALGLVVAGLLSIIGGSQLYFQNSEHAVLAEQASALAESGLDKAVASMNKTGGVYNGELETILGNGSYSVTVTDKDVSTKLLQATGYIPSKTDPKIQKTIKVQVSKGTGISFVYAMLVGSGGISMGNGSSINGTLYSNGNVSGGNGSTVTGDVFVAGGIQPTADQQNECSLSNCVDYIFGKSITGENRLYVAQSFKPSSSEVLRKVSLKLKKIGSPANLTVRIMKDINGMPDKNNVLAAGSIASNVVTSEYAFADALFSSNPALSANTTYWIMVGAAALDNSNYWMISEDLAKNYLAGFTAWSPDWQDKNPVWNNIQGDFGFKTWMGGVATSIDLGTGSIVQGSVHASLINGVTINKDAYYQTITNSVVKGQSFPGSADPTPAAMPISEANMTEWKTQAQNISVSTGDISGCPATIGPGKIVGNMIINNSCVTTIKTPVWITGNVTLGNASTLKMDSSLGIVSGLMIVDGTTDFGNSVKLLGTGQSGSNLALLSTYNSQASGGIAINTGNNPTAGILYAPNGKIMLANGSIVKEVVGWQITLGNFTALNYDSGLSSTFFSSGPSGSFSLVKGTYQTK